MELVKGVPITQYCEDHRLTPKERLELFIPLCQAVQHAHQKGIIHRDLKPSNVLIALYDGRPVPKIIDFGVAKAMGPKLTERTLYTEFGSIIGTLEYMSPEQAELNQLDVDTRSDIYSLGVLLYELLTGTTPLERKRVQETSVLEVLRIIREEEPPRPSTRLSHTLRAQPAAGADRRAAGAAIRPPRLEELDWIVMKCLEKERNRRYDTAHSLALDLERYLRDETVSACPPSAAYRFRKLARRHKVVLVTTLTVALSLALAVLVLSVSMVRIKTERDEKTGALAQAEKARDEAMKARDEATRRRYRSLVEEARASRRSHRVGQRFDSLGKLEEAATLARDLGLGEDDFLELRNEVIACFALPDLRKIRDWRGFPEGSHTIDWDPVLERYARCDRQGKISVRRIADDSELVSFPTDLGPMDLMFSPDGQYLSSATGPGGQVKVWKVGPATSSPILALSDVRYSCFSGDSRHCAVARDAQVVQIYDLGTGRPVARLALKDRPAALAFHPFERQIAVGLPACIQILDQDSGNVVTELGGSTGNDYLAWHPGGKRLAAVGSDRIVRQWDVATGQQVARMEGIVSGGVTLFFNRAGTLAASQGWESKLRLWSPRNGEQLFQTDSDWPMPSRFSTDDRRLLLLRGEQVQLREIAGDRAFREVPIDSSKDRDPGMRRCSVCPKNDRLVAANVPDGIGLWDLATGEPLEVLDLGGSAHALFDGTGALLMDFARGNVHRLPFEAGSGSPAALRFGPPETLTLLGKDGRCLACSPDGRVVVAGQRNGAFVWHRDLPEKLVRLTPQPDVRSAVVSGDGRLVATGSHSGPSTKVWDARTGDCLKTFEGALGTVAFSPDQKWLFVGGRNQLFKVDTWEAGPVVGTARWGVAFSPDSGTFAEETGQGAIRLRQVATGREYARLEDPRQHRVNGITFSPDGTKLLTTSGEDNAIHVWDLRALRQELAKFRLDWDEPAFEPAREQPGAAPLKLTVDLGDLARPGKP
jgi:WD40 repeat protein